MQKIEKALDCLGYYLVNSNNKADKDNDFKLLSEAQQELAELKQLLKDIEFVDGHCPYCHAREGDRHKAYCKLAKFIKRDLNKEISLSSVINNLKY